MNILKVPILKRLYPSIVRRIFIFFGKIKFIYKIKEHFFELDIRESIERKAFFEKNYEEDRMNFLISNSKKINSEILIDVGAYIGFYSIMMGEHFKKIFAFEPHSRNFKILNENIIRNNLHNRVKTYNSGLADEKKELYGESKSKGKLLQSSGFSLMRGGNVKISLLVGDEVLKFKNKVITIKIDVEGFELNVLKGIKKLLQNNKCLVQVEIWKINFQKVHKFLNNLNYQKMKTIDGDTFFLN